VILGVGKPEASSTARHNRCTAANVSVLQYAQVELKLRSCIGVTRAVRVFRGAQRKQINFLVGLELASWRLLNLLEQTDKVFLPLPFFSLHLAQFLHHMSKITALLYFCYVPERAHLLPSASSSSSPLRAAAQTR
jgi:hypothetical protein